MYRHYSIQGSMGGGSTSVSAETALSLISTTTIRPYIYDFSFGSVGTPSDSLIVLSIPRLTNTTAGTGCTSSPPDALDHLDDPATSTAGMAYTAEPTIGVVLFQVGINVRATYRWVASPGGELVCPATAAAGLGIRSASPVYTLDASVTAFFAE